MATGGPGGIRGGGQAHSCSSLPRLENSGAERVDRTAREKMHRSASTFSKWGFAKRNVRHVVIPVVAVMAKLAWNEFKARVTGGLSQQQIEAQKEIAGIYKQGGVEGLVKELCRLNRPVYHQMAARFFKDLRENLFQRLPLHEEKVIAATEQRETLSSAELKEEISQFKQAKELIDAKARIPTPTESRYAELERIEAGKETYWLGFRTRTLTDEERSELEAMRAFKALLPQEENVWSVPLPDPGELESVIETAMNQLTQIDAANHSLQQCEDEVLNCLMHSLLYGVEASEIAIKDYTKEALISFAKQHAVRMPLPPQLNAYIDRTALAEKAGSQLYSMIQATSR